MRVTLFFLLLAASSIVALFLLPTPVDPIGFSPAGGRELTGVLAPNRDLLQVDLLARGLLHGPEDIEIDAHGSIITGVAEGSVLELSGDAYGVDARLLAATRGRPLGLDLDLAGTLWVADSLVGLLSIGSRGGLEVRSRSAAGVPIGFADDVDTDSTGKVYFSDASTRFGPGELHLEVLEARPHGRLLMYDPVTGRTEELLDGLYFANGVAVSRGDRFILVAETFRYRIRRYWLAGPRKGEDEIFLDHLPGFPDGVSSTERGTFWVAIHSLRSPLLDTVLHPRPWLKRNVAKLPRSWLQARSRYGLVLEISEGGTILRSLHDPTGERFAGVTSAEEHNGSLYLGTVEGKAIGRVELR